MICDNCEKPYMPGLNYKEIDGKILCYPCFMEYLKFRRNQIREFLRNVSC